jgi:outer membrane protein OmpA-like peptidoglycan-associated protein
VVLEKANGYPAAGARCENEVIAAAAVASGDDVMHIESCPKGFRAFRVAACLVVAAAVALACAGDRASTGRADILSLEEGVLYLIDQLLEQIPPGNGQRRVVAVDRFADAATGEVPRAGVRIESIVLKPSPGRDELFQLIRLSPERGSAADYLIAGTLSPEAGAENQYRLRGVVKDLRADRIIGNATVRILESGLDYTPMAIYRDNPFFDPGYRKKKFAEETPRPSGPPGFEDYSVYTLALLRAASVAYERGDHEDALSLFNAAARRPDGQTLWTYAGLYLTYEKLGRREAAEKAFESVVALSVEKHRMLTVRFLFKVDSIAFWGGDPAARRYETWLRHIGEYFRGTDHCLKIVGHCSKSGPENWNRSLSLMRAEKIQEMLGKTLPETAKRTRAEGRGSKENVVGIGTDDERDVLDRRVELMIVECP